MKRKKTGNIFKSFALSATMMLASQGVYAGADVHWDYAGDTGPEHWAELSEEFATCGSGVEQSPINIDPDLTVTKDLRDINVNYKSWALSVVNNGHTVQVNMAPGSKIRMGRKTYYLLQFHFHTASENTIDGKQFPMEAHFVHMNSHGELGVLAVMFEEGAENETLAAILSTDPSHAGEHKLHQSGNINPMDLLPSDENKIESYYNFAGSLTTPPCSEGVNWLVAQEAVNASAVQLEMFTEILTHHGEYPGNNRPVQPLNDRIVSESEE